MRTRPLLASLLAASLAFPSQAFAQEPSPPVQPVPYAPSQPVPYPAGAPDSPPAVNVPRAASPVGSDVVYLKGGGMIRGTLVEALPNDHATVQLTTGQSAIIPWVRIERIERGGSPAPVSPPSAVSVPAVPRAPEGTVFVHIEADQPVNLERRDGGRVWSFTCTSPCDAEVPLSSTYRVGGTGIRNSAVFHLNARPGDRVVLDVNTASKGTFVGGIVVAGAGVLVLLVGAMVLLTVATVDTANTAEGIANNASSDSSANTVGWVMVAGGAAATVVGVLLLTSNTHSKVDQTPASQRPRTDAWLRAPTWHDDKTGAALPKVVPVPLLHFAF